MKFTKSDQKKNYISKLHSKIKITGENIILKISTLKPHCNTYFGVHKKSVLYQNSVITRVLCSGGSGTGEVSSGSQASTML